MTDRRSRSQENKSGTPNRSGGMRQELRLGIDVRMYRMAGIGRYLRNLLPELLPRLNVSKISILGNASDLATEQWLRDPRIRVEDFRPRIFSLAEQWAPIAGRYRHIDLLWSPQYNLPLLYNGRLVVTIHDLCQVAHPETLGSELQRRYARFLLSQVVKRTDAVLCVSEFTASETRKYLHADRNKIVVAYPPLGESITASAGLKRDPGCSYFLAVGNVKKHKNIPRLIAAYNSIRDKVSHDLVIVGSREGFRNSETALDIDSLIRDSRIRFTGYVTDEELKSWYRNAIALVFPSYYEGFGYPLVEAMAQGCPIVCSNVASLPEVAGDAAVFFDPFAVEEIASSMLRIASDEATRNALVLRGQQRFQRFLGDTCARITADTINRLVEQEGE